MKQVAISRIKIDATGRLLVYPSAPDQDLFQYVYRAGCEVSWSNGGFFHSPPRREWSYSRWFEQIRLAVRGELGIELVPTDMTSYVSIPELDALEIRRAVTGRA